MPEIILKIEGNLKVARTSMFPRPGKVDFRIEGAKNLIGKILSVNADVLPPVATTAHMEGKVTIEIFSKEVDNSEYAASLPKPTRVPQEVKTGEEPEKVKPKTKRTKKNEIRQTTGKSE